MEFDATFWSLVGLVIFLGLVAYLGVPKLLGAALDRHGKAIADELDNARRLREEAQALLAEYQRRRQSAEEEAEGIVAAARAEAERMKREAEAALAATIERRTRAVEVKIAQAEARALADVRGIAADIAIAAATRVLGDKVKGGLADDLVGKGIAETKAGLN